MNSQTHRRLQGDGGATIVEFALVLPLLALLIFGIIDFGTTYNDWQALRSGVRDAARQAAVFNLDAVPAGGCAATSPSGGTSGSAVKQQIICMVKSKAGLGNEIHVSVWANPSWDVGNTLRVCAQARATSTTGVTAAFLNNKIMTAKVEMRIEQALPTGTTFNSPVDSVESALSSWPSGCS